MVKLTLSGVRRFLLFLSITILIFASGYAAGNSGLKGLKLENSMVVIDREVPANREVNFNLFWETWDILEERYFDKAKINKGEMVYGAISGLVSSLGDPYTVFLPPKDNKLVQEDLGGSFEGVGIQIGFRGTRLAVIAPLPGSPAEAGGVKAGDYIVHIKDEKRKIDIGTVGIDLARAVQAIRGPARSMVTLTVLRDNEEEPLVFEIERKQIEVKSVSLEIVDSVAHIKLLKFGGETEGEWQSVVDQIAANSDVKGIVLDLRNNPGGYLMGAVDIASEFMESGSIVVMEEQKGEIVNEFKVDRIGRLLDIRIVVLVNKGSASASEILAGALRDNEGTAIIGETTFGKGTIQEPIQLKDGSGLHITTAKWLTPKKTWVNGGVDSEGGLKPDYEIIDDEETVEDEQLLKAIEVLNSSL